MKFLQYIFLWISLLVLGQFSYAQDFDKPHSSNTSIFEKHQQNTEFLDKKSIEIDKINTSYKSFFQTKKHKQFPVSNAQELLDSLKNSFQNFTDFNSRRLVKIDKELAGNKPVKGGNIAYLHHSFKVYKKYLDTYDAIYKKAYSFHKKETDKEVSKIMLRVQLEQMSFFYKNYYSVIKNTQIRRVLNASDAVYSLKDNDFRKIVRLALKRKNYKSIQKTIKKKHLKDFIDTPLFFEIKNTKYSKSRIKKDKHKTQKFFRKDNNYQIGKFFTHYISGAIGNAAGMVRIRKGYLYKNDAIQNLIKTKLKPMDILAEKTGFALTDKMIPGYFGHIALWLGTEEQLKNEGLWDSPTIKPFQNRIRNGYCVLESARNGTHLKTLEDFVNVDELAIARIIDYKKLNTDDKIALYQNALAQLGKEYDFNFDVETSDKLVCSELLYQVFGSIYWPTDKFLKRATISPDNVLSLALYQNTPIELVYYIEAKNKKTFCTKTLDQLAKDLGYKKQNNKYVLPDKQCKKENVSSKKKQKKKCEKIYHELIYQE